MGEDTPLSDLALGEIDETRQDGSGGAGEPDALGHKRHPFTRRQPG
jgi:hypothetical protein